MTVSNTTAKLQYSGDGTTRTFGITFPLLSADHLSVVVTDTSGTETQITNNYTLSDDLDSITYPTEASGLDPLASGYKITLIRQTPLTQQIDLHSGGVLDAEQLESGYDKLTLLVQELKTQLDRCIKYAVSNASPQAAEQFLTDITTAATNAANSATAAAGSASTASTKASNAAASETAAAGYATSAYNYSQAANGYVSDAQTHAQSAATYATQAEGYKESAETASETAVAAQEVVEGYKDDAADYASAAGESALAAATSESHASGYATAASNSKTAAQQAANAAASAKTDAESAAATCATADTKISNHNDSNTAHADIRALIKNYTAGTNVTISDDGVISAQDTTYTAGTNVTIVGNVISATGGGGGGSVDIDGSLDPDSPNPVANSALYAAITAKQPKTLDAPITVAGESKTTVEAALGAINTMAAGKAAGTHTHTKSEITDFPTIPTVPTKLSDFTDDLGSSPTHTHSQYLESVAWDDVTNKPESFTPASHTHTKSNITDFPTIPTKLSDLTDDLGTNPTHSHSQYLTSVPVATTAVLGGVKPDGTTITVDGNGVITAAGGSGGGITATYDSTNKILTLE